jgi:hypothetical protein
LSAPAEIPPQSPITVLDPPPPIVDIYPDDVLPTPPPIFE